MYFDGSVAKVGAGVGVYIISPIKEKNGEIRLCIDFRNLNKVSLKDNYPLPKMDHIL